MPDLTEINGEGVLQHAANPQLPQDFTLGEAIIKSESDKILVCVN